MRKSKVAAMILLISIVAPITITSAYSQTRCSSPNGPGVTRGDYMANPDLTHVHVRNLEDVIVRNFKDGEIWCYLAPGDRIHVVKPGKIGDVPYFEVEINYGMSGFNLRGYVVKYIYVNRPCREFETENCAITLVPVGRD